MDLAVPVRHAGEVDNPPFWAGFEFVHQKCSQQKVAKMINSQLLFEALSSLLPLLQPHHSSIIQKNVELLILFGELLGERLDGLKVIQI
jgi:hypothetical protein